MDFTIEYLNSGGRSVDQYGEGDYEYSWEEHNSYSYYHAYIVTEGYSEVTLFPGEKEAEPGDDIHVVYVSYDTGDSFGREYDRREHLWAFTDKKKAMQLAETIYEDAKQNPDYDYKNRPLNFEGAPINTNTWKGYFEHFNNADIVTLTAKKERK